MNTMCTAQIGRARPIDSCQTRSVPVYQIQIMSVLVAMKDKYTARPNRFDPTMKAQPIFSNVAIVATSGAKIKRGYVAGELTLPPTLSRLISLWVQYCSTMLSGKSRDSLSLPCAPLLTLSSESYGAARESYKERESELRDRIDNVEQYCLANCVYTYKWILAIVLSFVR